MKIFENQIELKIRAFFFNAKTDYLPYYKNFSFMIDTTEDILLKDILPMIKEQNPDFSYPEKELIFRVNNLVVTGYEKLSTVIDRLGVELTIDPVLKYRSDNGLIINNHDFMHQFRRILGHYASKEDLEFYLRLYPVHYASETFNYNKEYIGDAILILANKMISDGNPNYIEILDAINDEFDGISCCEYENNLFKDVDYSKDIDNLKAMIPNKKKISIIDSLINKISARKEQRSYDVDLFQPQNIALYVGDKSSAKLIEEIKELVESSGSTFIEFDMATKKAGQSIIDTNPKIAYKKAGKMLLEAFDNGATVLAFAKDKDLEFFSSIHDEVESAVGRDINLNIVSLSKLKELTQAVEA
jgi:hypothetical protein